MRKTLLILIISLVTVITYAGDFYKHTAHKGETHFTWDCYGEVATLDAAITRIHNELDLANVMPDVEFRLQDTVTDGNRTHYYYRGYKPEGALAVSLFEVHTIKQGGNERPYFANGAIDTTSKEKVDTVSPTHPVVKLPEGTMKQCEVETMYSGKQIIDYYQTTDGTGWLYDANRNIYAFDANAAILNNLPRDTELTIRTIINQDSSVKAMAENLKPFHTDGDLFATGYAPFYINIDSINFYAQRYWLEEHDTTITATISLRNNITGVSQELRSIKITCNNDIFAEYKDVIRLDSPIAITHPNWDVVLTLNGITDVYPISLNDKCSQEINAQHNDKDGDQIFNAHINSHIAGSQPALDAFLNAQKVYDTYNEVFGIKGFDGGKPIYLFANNPASNGAGALTDVKDKCAILVDFGSWERNTTSHLASVCVNTLGHEFTHSLQTLFPQGQLAYIFESGALNESFADIMGLSLGHIAYNGKTTLPSWAFSDHSAILAGYDVTGLTNMTEAVSVAINFRNFKTPELCGDAYPQPKYYKGEYYKEADEIGPGNDSGYVHINSGVQNHWYYLMCEGGEKTVPWMDALTLAFQTLKYYTFPIADYTDVYHLYKAAAKYQEIAGTAFADGSNDLVKAVVDNWHKVGVCLDIDSTDGITEATSDNTGTSGKAYDITGRRVNADTYKGLIILNGKKIVR